MENIKRLVMLAAMALALAACGGDDGGEPAPGDDSSAEDWCEGAWEDDLAPADWDHERFMRDCLEALEAGYTRELTRSIYEDIKDGEAATAPMPLPCPPDFTIEECSLLPQAGDG